MKSLKQQIAEEQTKGVRLKRDLKKHQKENKELERKLHAARTLWCDSKRDPATGMVDVKVLDQFEEAISEPVIEKKETL